MTQSEKVKAIVKILKKRFPNLTTEETVHISFEIVEKMDEPPKKVTNNE